MGRQLFRRLAVDNPDAASGVAVARHFDKRDGQDLRVDVEFLVQDLSDAFGRPRFCSVVRPSSMVI